MIDISYFAWRDTRITNITEKCNDRNLYFTAFMNRMQEEVLRFTLGNCVYEELKTQLDTDGNLIVGADAKWSNLLYGEIYDASVTQSSCSCGCSECEKHRWRGIYNQTHKRSYVAHYISEQWNHENEFQIYSTGAQVAEVKNSNTVSNMPHRINNHNEFVNWVYYGFGCGELSLCQYMCEKEDLFPEWNIQQRHKHTNLWNI